MNNEETIEYEIKKQMEREFQLELERDKLEDTIKQIHGEILKYVEKRKEISNYIVEHRKNAIEEYKDDEDKLIEYFDHERYIKEETFKTIDRRLKELTVLLTAPYFGRVDFKEEDTEVEKIYIGRFGITPEGNEEPLIVDWRAPVASLFYAGGVGNISYVAPQCTVDTEVLLKRQYIIKKEKLLGMFDSAVDIKDDILQWVLSSNSSEKLKDIIMTIQQEQDELIRQPKDKTIVVDGVAGSGKTTVALHRVAYLLYNYRNTLQDKVLILGPNGIFMEYISSVLPSLGEVGVQQQTFSEFALNILDLENVMDLKTYMEHVLDENETFLEQVHLKNSKEFIRILDSLVEKYDDNYFKVKSLHFYEKEFLAQTEIEEMFNRDYKTMPLFRRSKKIKRIIFSRIKDVRDEYVRGIQQQYKMELAKLTKAEKEIQQSSLDFVRRVRIREVIEEVIKVKKSLKWMENPDTLEIYNLLNENKPLTGDDLAPILYLKIKFEGLKYEKEIKHIVIDEAQDYSMLQFMVIQKVTNCNFFTIVGDGNQRTLPGGEVTAMTEVETFLPNINVQNFKLNKSYRSTREIMEYANQYIDTESKIVPLVRNGEPVKIIEGKALASVKMEILSIIANWKEKGFESIALVCKNLKTATDIRELFREDSTIKFIDKEEMIYSSGVVILPSYFVKGMEFDAVIMMKEKEESKLDYVMATRALHELAVFELPCE